MIIEEKTYRECCNMAKGDLVIFGNTQIHVSGATHVCKHCSALWKYEKSQYTDAAGSTSSMDIWTRLSDGYITTIKY